MAMKDKLKLLKKIMIEVLIFSLWVLYFYTVGWVIRTYHLPIIWGSFFFGAIYAFLRNPKGVIRELREKIEKIKQLMKR